MHTVSTQFSSGMKICGKYAPLKWKHYSGASASFPPETSRKIFALFGFLATGVKNAGND